MIYVFSLYITIDRDFGTAMYARSDAVASKDLMADDFQPFSSLKSMCDEREIRDT
jgi:hypothetical protein